MCFAWHSVKSRRRSVAVSTADIPVSSRTGERNAFGKFCLHKLRELAHNVAVVIEFDSANLDNLIAQPTALTLLWHRRKLKVQHDLARKVRRIDGQDTRRLFS